jgi:Protein of unknown function (DUF3592)
VLRRFVRPTTDAGVVTLLAGIFGAVALILLLIAAGLALHTGAFLRGSASATGTVVALVGRESCSTDSDGRSSCRIVHAPRVRFSTADGRQIEYLSRVANHPSPYHEGQQVEIRYRPADPTEARIYSFVDLWLAPVIVGGIGGIFGVIAGVLAMIARALWRRAETKPTPPERLVTDEPDRWQDPGTLR